MRSFSLRNGLLAMVGLIMTSSAAMAGPKDFHKVDATSETIVDHSAWNDILASYINRTEDNRTEFSYSTVTDADKQKLNSYIDALSSIDPTTLTRDESFAYWANLYNAVTVDVILDNYPVKSIMRITSGLRPGPWKRKLISINGEKLTLDNIEHDILRDFFKDNRVHYAVNCASYGCPNLAGKAFTSENLEEMLEAGARDYVNHPRGVTVKNGKVTASSIYKWFAADFGNNQAGVLKHLRKYAEPELQEQLSGVTKINKYDYSWALNDAK